uniref:Uncharacterized protein n=1 Tax=Anguilla anguilla TaxID=7936 RepID=A0A0E9U1J4_ANGAN
MKNQGSNNADLLWTHIIRFALFYTRCDETMDIYDTTYELK